MKDFITLMALFVGLVVTVSSAGAAPDAKEKTDAQSAAAVVVDEKEVIYLDKDSEAIPSDEAPAAIPGVNTAADASKSTSKKRTKSANANISQPGHGESLE